MTRTARSCWITAPGRAELRSSAIATPGPGQCLVQTRYSGISRGTERLVFEGRVPAGQQASMAAPFQEGQFPAPVKYGYINVGRVLEGPDGWVGRNVFCLYPHQDLYVVDATALTPLPDDLPAGRAVLTAYMETAVTAVWDAAPLVGERIVVIGAGVLGCLIAWLCARTAASAVTLVDIDPDKARLAGCLDLDFSLAGQLEAEADLVIHASGHPAGLEQALGLAGVEARIIETSWYGEGLVPLPLGAGFHSRRLTLRSSQVSRIPPLQAPRWSHGRRLQLAMQLLTQPQFDHLIGSESDFADLPATLASLARGDDAGLCHRVRYPAVPGTGKSNRNNTSSPSR